jgi:NitT/TauT family transport system permease protein
VTRSPIVERLAPWVLGAALLIAWELACVLMQIPEFVLPRPSRIIEATIQYAGPIWFHASQTLVTTLAGFVLAVGFGTLLGIAVGASRLFYVACYPLLVGFNSIPKAAVVPILVIWFGIGAVPAILTAFMMSFFPIAVNVATGLATVEPELEDVLLSLGASRRDIVVKVGLPRSLPYFSRP